MAGWASSILPGKSGWIASSPSSCCPHTSPRIPPLRERFLREARTAARLSQPNIVPIFAVDEAGEFVFYAMAYVQGESLAERLASRQGPMPPAEAARILREVAWALAYAHAQGVVHRDIKPENILLEEGSGRAMVADFGIARLVEASGGTGVGEVLGTPDFMSPEQAAAEPVDGRSDLYALGVVGYNLLTGRLPVRGRHCGRGHGTASHPPTTAGWGSGAGSTSGAGPGDRPLPGQGPG